MSMFQRSQHFSIDRKLIKSPDSAKWEMKEEEAEAEKKHWNRNSNCVDAIDDCPPEKEEEEEEEEEEE